MSQNANNDGQFRRYGALLLGAVLTSSVGAAAVDADERVLRAAAGYASERGPADLRDLGTLAESSYTPANRITKRRGGGYDSKTASVGYADHWIYDAGVELYFDADGDGYFRYLRVRFDVDSYYDPAWVFAQLWISVDGEVWELYYETEEFRVDGAVPDDEYEVETELLAHYPTGSYDVLIEIYDSDTGEFAAEFGPAQSSAFALLPLEDASRDGVGAPVVVVSEGGGGAATWPLLLLGGAGCWLRRGLARRDRASYPRHTGSSV